MTDRRRCLILLVLLVAAVVPYFVGLGDSAIWDANEAFYVETPREMIEAGDYISPTFNYQPRLNKPVLSYWIVAAFYTAFGVSVGVQRLAIALGAAGLIAVAFGLAWLGRPSGPALKSGRLEAALWAALGLAIAPRLLMFARRIFIDIYISLFMALALLCFAAAERCPRRRRLCLMAMYVAVGLGMLTKGPVAAVVPALVFAAYLIVHKELRRIREMMLPAGVLIVLAIVVPWYAALYQRHGWSAIVSFFVGENVDRFTSGLGVGVERGPWYYLPVILSDSFPWSFFLLPAAVLWWRDRSSPSSPDGRVRNLLWLWVMVIVGFFSLSAGKQDLYIFPIVPAVAALAALALHRGFPRVDRDAPAALAWTTGAIGLILLLLGGGLFALLQTAAATYAIAGIAPVGAIGIAGGATVMYLASRHRLFAAAAALAVAFLALNTVFVQRTLPSFEAYKPVPGFAQTISRRRAADAVVATYEQSLPSLVFYLRRHVEELFDTAALIATFGSGKAAYVVLSAGDYRRLRADLPVTSCILDRRVTFDVKLRNVLARQPLPELVLITNVCD